MPRLFHAGGAAAGSTMFPGLHGGMAMLKDLLNGSFNLDINRVSAALTIISFGAAAIRYGASIVRECTHYIQQFFTACVTVTAPDELHEQVLRWLSENVLKHQKTRLLTAKSVRTNLDGPQRMPMPRGARTRRRGGSIQYLPAYGTTWFFHDKTLFAVTRSSKRAHPATMMPGFDFGYADMMADESGKADEMLSIMCLGRSPGPIKNFLEQCRLFSRKLRKHTVTVRSCGEHGSCWDYACQKPVRPLDTLYLDDSVKQGILSDMRKYLNPVTQDFYQRRGIPYRRGYLLHGPPGTGKTSLSLALAGEFKLDLYVLNMTNVVSDFMLASMFQALPTKCIVLLEDIDAVGMKRAGVSEKEPNDNMGSSSRGPRGSGRRSSTHKVALRNSCTLSGLLNVLDGVASQEGRIVLMTTNDPDALDEALLRPGRVDRKYHLGCMNQEAIISMFLRMFEPEPILVEDQINATMQAELSKLADANQQHTTSEGKKIPTMDEVEQLMAMKTEAEREREALMEVLGHQAVAFAALVPERRFTPAKMQGYMLMHRESAIEAIANAPAWIEEELQVSDQNKQEVRVIKARTTNGESDEESVETEDGRMIRSLEGLEVVQMEDVSVQMRAREQEQNLQGPRITTTDHQSNIPEPPKEVNGAKKVNGIN